MIDTANGAACGPRRSLVVLRRSSDPEYNRKYFSGWVCSSNDAENVNVVEESVISFSFLFFSCKDPTDTVPRHGS